MTSFETGVWQATYGAAVAAGFPVGIAADRAGLAVCYLRDRAEPDWLPVLEGHIPLLDAEDTCPD